MVTAVAVAYTVVVEDEEKQQKIERRVEVTAAVTADPSSPAIKLEAGVEATAPLQPNTPPAEEEALATATNGNSPGAGLRQKDSHGQS